MHALIRSLIPAISGLLAIAAFAAQPALAQVSTFRADQAHADLDRLYSGLRSGAADLFSETPKHVFDARYAELSEKYQAPVSGFELHNDLQRFAALARQAHTRIEGLSPDWNAFVESDAMVFPLSFEVFQGEVIVTAAPVGSGVEPLDRIVALEGAPNPIWLARLTRNIGAETPELAYAMMKGGELYYLWLEYGPRPVFQVTIERNGESKNVSLDAVPISDLDTVTAGTTGFELPGREARMLDPKIAYLRPGAFYNLEATNADEAYLPQALIDYEAYVNSAFSGFIEQGATDLIVDLRDNSGGDNSYSDPVVAWFADRPFRFTSDFRIRVSAETIASNQARLDARSEESGGISAQLAQLYAEAVPDEMVSFEIPYVQPRTAPRYSGRVHVLVNRYSYSNAVTTAAMIQDYGFGTVYGEPTRDMATTYGALEHFSLPHSGARVGYPKAHIIRPNGDEKSRPVMPDVELSAPAVRGAEDLVLNQLLQRLRDN